MEDEDDRSRARLVARLALFVGGSIAALVLGVVAVALLWPSGSVGEPAFRAECLPRVDVSDTRVGRGTELVVSSAGFRCAGELGGRSTATVYLEIGEVGETIDEHRVARVDVERDGSFYAEVRIPAADVELTEPIGARVVVAGDAFRCRGDSCTDELHSERIEYVPI